MEFIDYINETPSLVDGVSCIENGDYRMMDKAGDHVYATGIRELLAKSGFQSINISMREERSTIAPKS